jgi:hypothetical protein
MIGSMRRWTFLLNGIGAALVAGLALGLRAGWMPRGVPGEWEWPRLPETVAPAQPALALLGLLAYAGLTAVGAALLGRRSGPVRESLGLAALAVAAVVVQLALHAGAPAGYGLTKWVTIDQPGSSGYFTIARTRIGDVRGFLASYPTWIQTQDALHIGTHPPGLFVASRGALDLFAARPDASRRVIEHLPSTVTIGFREVLGGRTPAERAAIALIGGLTLLACAGTVVPLYLLARSTGEAATAWSVAALWPVVPAAILFQPTSDCGFALLSTSALACSAWASRPRWGVAAAVGSGAILVVGMQFSLVFLAIGLIVALMALTQPGRSWRDRLTSIVATGVGFLGPTLAWWAWSKANPFVIWWANQLHHQRFYVEFPRTYGSWLIANPIELAVAIGLPMVGWGLVGLGSWRRARVSWLTLLVLIALTLSGRNLSEVARLWLPFQPALIVAVGTGLARLRAGPVAVAILVSLVALETLALEGLIQVVYPF